MLGSLADVLVPAPAAGEAWRVLAFSLAYLSLDLLQVREGS